MSKNKLRKFDYGDGYKHDLNPIIAGLVLIAESMLFIFGRATSSSL